MKNACLVLLFLCSQVFAAISPNTQWEVRTGGSDSNGGAFVNGAAGTDYSTQDAAAFSGTDLASVSSLVVSSASHNFVSTDVGDQIHITASTSGFTVGFYQIVSVASNQATLDRSPGTVGLGGTWAEGGGLLAISTAFSNLVPKNFVWIKTGTYTTTAGFSLPTVDSNTSYIVKGYSSAHGDLDIPGSGARPLITTATNSINLFTVGSAFGSVLICNLSMSNTAGTRAAGIIAGSGGSTQALTVFNCLFDGFTTGIKGNFSGDYYYNNLNVIATEVKNSTSNGVWNNGVTYLQGCFLHANTGAGFLLDNTQIVNATYTVVDTVFSGNQDGISQGVSTSNSTNVKNSVFYNQSRDGIRLPTTNNQTVNISNCIFDSNAGWAIDQSGAANFFMGVALNNAFRANTSGTYNGFGGTRINDITLTASPFNAAGTDFSLNATAGGGALLKAAGFPGIFGAGTGYLDIGALQSQGGAAGMIVNPGMKGNVQD